MIRSCSKYTPAFAIALLLTAGCGEPAGPPQSTLIYSRGSDADVLDPIHTSVGETVKVLTNIYDTLVAYDETSLELVPSLATEWEVSDDGRTWTFQLREGVTFHDGTPFDAEAVVFTFERVLEDDHPHVHLGTPPYRPNFETIESVRATGPLEVTFGLKTPSAVFFENLAMFPVGMVSPTAVKKHGKAFADHPVGTGPFKLGRWTRNQQIVLEAFDDHWRGRPPLDRVVFVRVQESSARVRQLQNGECHIADNLPPTDLEVLADDPHVVIQRQPGLNVAYLVFQTEKPPLDDLRVRRAIWHAIDKKRLIEVAYAGQAQPAVSLVPPTVEGANDELVDRAFDPAKARALLEQAAADGGFELPLKLTLFVPGGPRPYLQQPRQTGAFIKDALEKVGVDVSIVTDDIRQYFRRLSRGEHDLALAGWTGDTPDVDTFLYSLLDPSNISDDGGNNLSRYRNERVHELLKGAQQELNEQQRAAMYREAQQIIFDEAPVVPLVHTDVAIALRDNVEGYTLHPSSIVRLRTTQLEDAKR